MNKKLFLLITATCISQFIFAQINITNDWRDHYTNAKIDTIVENTRFVGEYINQKREGWWYVYPHIEWRVELKKLMVQKVLFKNDVLVQYEYLNDHGVHCKQYVDSNNRWCEFRNSIVKDEKYLIVRELDENKKYHLTQVWYSNVNHLVSDTSYGLKKLLDGSLVDRNNKKYTFQSSFVKITDHNLIDEQVTINTEGNPILKRMVYQLTRNRRMTFVNNKMIEYEIMNPVFTRVLNLDKRDPKIYSKRRDVVTIADDLSDTMLRYTVYIDEKPVVKGFYNGEGKASGVWKLYHFQYFSPENKRKTAAFSATGMMEYEKVLHVDAPFGIMMSYVDLLNLQPDNISDVFIHNDLERNPAYFEGIDCPYFMTKYATYTKEGNSIVLEDNFGYHLFQKLQYVDGKLMKGFLYTPDGEIYDSLNFFKDDFGESVTKNSSFKSFPAHAKAQAYLKQLSEGMRMILTAVNIISEEKSKEEWKNIKCSYCHKPLNAETAIVVNGITCKNTTYPGGGNFCSSKCRYEFEAGYCRNQQ